MNTSQPELRKFMLQTAIYYLQVARQQQPRGLNKTKEETVNLEISFKFTVFLFKIHPPHQINKTRFGAKFVPARINFDKSYLHLTLLERFFEII